jgi:dihydroneopterin aldolase
MAVKRATLFLRDFELAMDIGIHAFEIGRPQRVLVDVEMDVAPTLAFERDDLAGVIDYDFLRGEIAAVAASRRFNTQEAFCAEILARVLMRDNVTRAVVTTRKPDVYDDAAAVGCRMEGEK